MTSAAAATWGRFVRKRPTLCGSLGRIRRARLASAALSAQQLNGISSLIFLVWLFPGDPLSCSHWRLRVAVGGALFQPLTRVLRPAPPPAGLGHPDQGHSHALPPSHQHAGRATGLTLPMGTACPGDAPNSCCRSEDGAQGQSCRQPRAAQIPRVCNRNGIAIDCPGFLLLFAL